jgi:hypothetical protein
MKPVIPAQAGIQLDAGVVKPSVRTASVLCVFFVRMTGQSGRTFRFSLQTAHGRSSQELDPGLRRDDGGR